nr:hypothetical protein [uncultured Cohaesibacter sp.]
MPETSSQSFKLSFPEKEGIFLRETYSKSNVILEYGSGGSTVIASQMENKKIFSVESDFDWTQRLQKHIIELASPSLPLVFYVDIGNTGEWGRPLDDSNWTNFYQYPMSIWHLDTFCDPDVVLIDGRFRAACMIYSLMRIVKPTIILIDDYVDRIPYHIIEQIISPSEVVGRMAVFECVPNILSLEHATMLFQAVSQITYAGRNSYYKKNADEAIILRHQELHMNREHRTK